MDRLFLMWLGLAFAVSSAIYFALNPRSREAVLTRLSIRCRKTDASLTPPRSISPGEKTNFQPGNHELFPPHRREALAALPPGAVKGPGKSAKELSRLPPDYSNLIPDKAVCNTDDLLYHTTPTGFTVEEINRLGHFPDYATLSGLPLPNEYKDFDISTAMPRPYRPFRWPYHQTMSLMKLEPDFWLELDKNYASVIKQRLGLYHQHGENVLRALPGSELATKELVEICLQFLCARYPKYFSLDKDNTILRNGIFNTETNLRTTEPLQVLLHNVPEDFAIMIRDPHTGIYSFRGGIIMSSLGWDLGSKIGLKLHEIHGNVPDYPEKMQFSMDRYFAKKPTDRGIQRGSWGFEIDQPLYMPPGDPGEKLKEIQDPTLTIERLHLRVDHQTLRRLPLSGAVVFNFKGLFTPVQEFRDEPYIPSLVLKVLREGKTSIMEYKNTWHTAHVLIPALEEYEREQIKKGLIERDREITTLNESPFFPGWQAKHSRLQGSS